MVLACEQPQLLLALLFAGWRQLGGAACRQIRVSSTGRQSEAEPLPDGGACALQARLILQWEEGCHADSKVQLSLLKEAAARPVTNPLSPCADAESFAPTRHLMCSVCRYRDLVSHPSDGYWGKLAPIRTLSVDIECAGRKVSTSCLRFHSVHVVHGHSPPRIRALP